jgi:hypothetical protein
MKSAANSPRTITMANGRCESEPMLHESAPVVTRAWPPAGDHDRPQTQDRFFDRGIFDRMALPAQEFRSSRAAASRGTLLKQKQNCGNERERPKTFVARSTTTCGQLFLNLNPTKGQVAVVKQNVELANENLTRSKDHELLCR